MPLISRDTRLEQFHENIPQTPKFQTLPMCNFYLNYQTIYSKVTDTIVHNKMHDLDVPDISLQKVTILLPENAI